MKKLLIVPAISLSFFVAHAQNIDTLFVSPQHPVKIADTVTKKKIEEWLEGFQSTANVQTKVQASTVIFPGLPKKGYGTITVSKKLLHRQPGGRDSLVAAKYVFAFPDNPTLYSTALYAPPGQKIGIELPENWNRDDVWVQIGAHNDILFWTNEDWRRMPLVFSMIKLTKDVKFISSPFGGLIYFAVRPNATAVISSVKLNNVIQAPYFKAGKTSSADWKKQLANNKAPWGEIASDKVIITLPDSALQKIKDPEKTMRTWDRIISAEYELSGLKSPLIRPLRMVVDEHISAGFMHSGYPIMIHHSLSAGMLSLDIITDINKLLQVSEGANWGFFHEIGHNLQNWEWVFDGTTEVGCNLYSLYVFDKVIGSKNGHENISAAHQKVLMTKYFSAGAKYEDWQKEPFLGLIPFMQLQKQYGWEPFKKVFKWYIDHPNDSLNYADETSEKAKEKNIKKINLFVTRFSTVTKTNLAPFFTAWGIPVSDSVNNALKGYITWIPQELNAYLKMKPEQ